jgi:hypothetical protein
MADGSRKPIKDVKLGDKVLATDPTTGKSAAREVTDVRSHASQRTLVEVTIGTGSVVATDEHPFWVASGKRWSHAIDLKPGHKLATPDNRDATITATKSWSESRRVYNLTIDTDHTYHIVAGAQALLVHNDDCDSLEKFADRNRDVIGVQYVAEYTDVTGRAHREYNARTDEIPSELVPAFGGPTGSGGHHGGCAETRCIITAYNKARDRGDENPLAAVQGGTMRVLATVSSYTEKQGLIPKRGEHKSIGTPCQRCASGPLANLGISVIQ